MNRKMFEIVFEWLILIALFTSGCMPAFPANSVVPPTIVDGQAVGIQSGTAQYIVEQARSGASFTGVFERTLNGQAMRIYTAQVQHGVAFVGTVEDDAMQEFYYSPGGQVVNMNTWQGFRDWLITNGWMLVAIGRDTVITLSASMYDLMPVFLIIPDEGMFSVYPEGMDTQMIDVTYFWVCYVVVVGFILILFEAMYALSEGPKAKKSTKFLVIPAMAFLWPMSFFVMDCLLIFMWIMHKTSKPK